MKDEWKKYGKVDDYNGIEMRSNMERRVAKILDKLDIEWVYEPEVEDIYYIPDFYLSKQDTYIEVKGVMTHSDMQKIAELHRRGNNVIIIEGNRLSFMGEMYTFPMELVVGNCSECGEIFFQGKLGKYNCPACGNYEGDHDLIKYFNSDDGLEEFKKISLNL